MPKNREEGEPLGSDSFLDVVCNMVGIIVILIMVTALRAGKHIDLSANGPAKVSYGAVMELTEQAKSIEDDVLRLADEMEQLQLTSAVKFEERGQLAYRAEQARALIDDERRKLGALGQADFDLRRAASAADGELARLDEAIAAAASGQEQTVRIVSYPTPIGKTVNGKEAHFQLKGGRVALVPIEKLLDRLPGEMRRQQSKLMEQYEVTSTAGPVAGFRMRYTLERDGNYIRLYECQFLPVNQDIGEPGEMALAETSEFRREIAALDPKSTTITLWTYPDSFNEFRRLKQDLYLRGFQVAGRPLPNGQPIGGSPHGSKSVTQ